LDSVAIPIHVNKIDGHHYQSRAAEFGGKKKKKKKRGGNEKSLSMYELQTMVIG
jgi:hypothetical protein